MTIETRTLTDEQLAEYNARDTYHKKRDYIESLLDDATKYGYGFYGIDRQDKDDPHIIYINVGSGCD